MGNEKTRTYQRVGSKDETLGVYEGSPLDEALAGDDDWELVGGAKRAAASDPAPKTDKEIDENTDLSKLKRPELDQVAAQRGVTEPEKLPSKDAVIEAIAAAQAEGAQGDGEGDES